MFVGQGSVAMPLAAKYSARAIRPHNRPEHLMRPAAPDATIDATIPSVCQIADDAFACAYDAVPDGHRAALKTCIAALHVLYGEPPLPRSETFALPRSGMAYGRTERVVPWALVVIDETFCSAPRLLAALMPALCAAVPDVRVVRLAPATSPWPDQLLVALELAGQEVAGSLEAADIGRLVAGLNEAGGGRVLCLGHPESFAAVYQTAFDAGIPVWHDGGTPHITLVEDEGVDTALVHWAHADARVTTVAVDPTVGEDAHSTGDASPACGRSSAMSDDGIPSSAHASDAVFCGAVSASSWLSRSRLVLTPTREGCWAFPDLSPVFFIERSLSIGRHVPATPFSPEMLHD